jgi:dihydrofolate reductase
MTTLSLIVAVAQNGVIGLNNRLPWHIPKDLAFFKKMTLNKPLLMGKNTFLSLPGLLPKRRHLILSRSLDVAPEGTQLVRNLEEAFALTQFDDELMVIGGAQIFALCAPLATRLYKTYIQKKYDGDCFLPNLGQDWVEIFSQDDDGLRFVIYQKPQFF